MRIVVWILPSTAEMTSTAIIITSANELQPHSAVIAKYLWLIRYFNAFAKNLHEGVTGLKIGRVDVPLSDESIDLREALEIES